VQYRASDTLLPASGTFVADSGRSIFLEQSFEQRGQHRHFRWEIPYQCLIRIAVTKDDSTPASAATATRREEPAPEPAEPAAQSAKSESETAKKLAQSAVAGIAHGAGILPLNKRAQSA
jgi:hypothetical protein